MALYFVYIQFSYVIRHQMATRFVFCAKTNKGWHVLFLILSGRSIKIKQLQECSLLNRSKKYIHKCFAVSFGLSFIICSVIIAYYCYFFLSIYVIKLNFRACPLIEKKRHRCTRICQIHSGVHLRGQLPTRPPQLSCGQLCWPLHRCYVQGRLDNSSSSSATTKKKKRTTKATV